MSRGSPRLVERRAVCGADVGAAESSEACRIPHDLEAIGADVGTRVGGAAIDSAGRELCGTEVDAVVDPLPALTRAGEIEPLVAAALEIGRAPFLGGAIDGIASGRKPLRRLPEPAGKALGEIDVGI